MGSLDQLKDSSLLGLPGVKPLAAVRSPGCLRERIWSPPLSPVAMTDQTTNKDSWR